MMKKVVLLVLLFALVSAKFTTLRSSSIIQSIKNQELLAYCPGATCANVGQSCGLDLNNYVSTNCNNGYCSSTTSGTCQAYTATGQTCTVTGSTCNPDTDICYAGTSSTVCTTVTYTLDVGATCVPGGPVQCAGSAYCDVATTKCIKFPKTGDSCDISYGCGDASYCKSTSGTTGTCTAYFQVAAGGTCGVAEDCAIGTFCYTSPSTGTSTCVTNVAPSQKTCDPTNPGCNQYESCTCTSLSTTATNATTCQVAGDMLTQSYANNYNSALNCFYNNNCGGEVTSCSSCKKSICNYYHSVVAATPAFPSNPAMSCFIPGAYQQLNSWCGSASVLGASLLMLALAIAALL